ncbi:Lrp/AsnC family leucine-responsive transcriptional regulator [Clostridium saccharoperbutylacetonicum]|uniref:Putative transcriptional regulator, AsnC family n=1 Tax=Clostridium saccharoperbutylacetonicum N1-4(HMT) TaxID=931276 RepID=M1MDH8_9CLOT|nr:Lrp/AsnC family transcriptional regulator [Clostridium saccharoperbutylacetonicum]AGF55979.1 putative transcriptional regulator, AsnC family [Clostridium saccharoperbutylacetonicum N1-4(HMT)]NRT63282.1 Lrp/AsnC family leucine-responsive transcriptional regulator [Clostridium saccharoperbutylacetonicum]NSB26644.1 Lrp/AsnC family leucine-responsive transcriptional regulator [Clostridium saccharoperbutylacetonicum]NSB45994.1 Lrp/AsnC family leucine-responsive transcriptional regulator [Clostrid
MFDEIDLKIIEMLKINSKMPLKEIGEVIHLTPQGVSNRIIRLQNLGIITGYTICINNALLGKNIIAYITIFMKTTKHDKLIKFLQSNSLVDEAHKISGDGCYLLKIICLNMDEINSFLDCLTEFGTYRLNLSTASIK